MIHDGPAIVSSFVSAGLVFGMSIESERLLEFAAQPSKFTRHDFEPGHFTVSTVLADERTGRVFLIRHPKLGRWLQPGGHIEEADASVLAAAVREGKEETGYRIDQANASPVALSIHRIPAWGAEPSHLHLDLQFLFSIADPGCSSGAELSGRWFSFDSQETAGALEHTRDRVQKLLRR